MFFMLKFMLKTFFCDNINGSICTGEGHNSIVSSSYLLIIRYVEGFGGKYAKRRKINIRKPQHVKNDNIHDKKQSHFVGG